jgi:hypothetical protein
VAFWKTDADDRERFEKVGGAARLLYIDAGAWAQQQHFNKRGQLPDEWFIPDALVRKWGKAKPALELVRAGFWERANLNGRAGYRYVWIQWENTPDYIRRQREKFRDEWDRKQRAKQPRGEGETGATTWG